MANYNWSEIKTYYIGHEDVSYEDLHEKYGVAVTSIKDYQKRHKENWQELRKQTVQKLAEKLPEKVGEEIAEFQAEKLKIGKWMVGIGVTGIKDHPPKTARESREIIDSGYKISTEALGLNTPNTVADLIAPLQVIVNYVKPEKPRNS